jgi:hypothetical protein
MTNLKNITTAFIDKNSGVLYIPTPPDCKTTYTVYYGGVDAYNNRSEIPHILFPKEIKRDGVKLQKVNINSNLKINSL